MDLTYPKVTRSFDSVVSIRDVGQGPLLLQVGRCMSLALEGGTGGDALGFVPFEVYGNLAG